MLPRQDTWLSCHLPRHGQEWGRHGPLGCFSTSAPCSRLGSRVLVSCPCGFQLTCQDGVQLCHHVLCVVQAEAHRWLKFQDVPSRTISAQQNVVLLQPVGQDTAGPAEGPTRLSSAWPWPQGQRSSYTAPGALTGRFTLGLGTGYPLPSSCPSFVTQHQWPLSALYLDLSRGLASLIPGAVSATPRLATGLQWKQQ